MHKPVKHSVAVVIRNSDLVLSIRRPDDDDELPGIWGLPAGTYREGELVQDVIVRIGRDKLSVRLIPIRILISGDQERPRYHLEMELWEVAMEGIPSYPEWRWARFDVLQPGADSGSLCCELALKSRSRASL